jgi:acetyl esterase/lipase
MACYTNCTVINCNYRLCPDVKFPLPAYDAFAIVKDVINKAAILGIDKDRIVLSGDSAGAGLVMCVA